MIKTFNSAFKGKLLGDIPALKHDICQAIHELLVDIDYVIDAEPSCDIDHARNLQMIFGHGHIQINTKNIEYQEEYLLSEFGDDADQRNTLNKLKWEDIFIRLIIYRLGSYSYYGVEVDYIPEGHRIKIK